MVETTTELLDVELASHTITIARSYLIIVGQVLVYLSDIVLVREGIYNALLQFGMIAIVIQQDGTCGLPVTTSTTSFLEISLNGIRAFVVYNQADVGFVNTHAKSIGGYHDTYTVVLPIALSFVFLGMVQSCVVESSAKTCICQVLGYLTSMATTANVDNGRTLVDFKQMNQFVQLVVRMADEVGKILALEGHAENVEFSCVPLVASVLRPSGTLRF